MKICFRCKKEVMEGDHHYAFTEYQKEEVISINYAHKECWDDFLKRMGDVEEARGMLRGLKTTLTKMGILQPDNKEIIIK